MPNRSVETASYADEMTDLKLSIPDRLAHWVDDYAGRAGESRDEFLVRVVGEEIDRCHANLRAEFEDLLDGIEIDLDGKSATEWIRWDRDHRDDKRFGPDGHAR
jgi:hypothetical protein